MMQAFPAPLFQTEIKRTQGLMTAIPRVGIAIDDATKMECPDAILARALVEGLGPTRMKI
jgi:hypothetical protein